MGRIWLLVVCASCAHAGASGGGAGGGGGGGGGDEGNATFSVDYPDAKAATAKLGKRFYAKPIARCLYDNGREAHWSMGGAKVSKGELPAGLTLEDGVIGGVPNKAGSYSAHIELTSVVCAGKPYEGQGADIQITVK